MLTTTRQTSGFRDAPVRSVFALARSRALGRLVQEVRFADNVCLLADSGHPNRSYAWTGERSWTVAAALSSLIQPGSVFLDVGSFCGQHAMRAASLVGSTGRVVAVEPDPRCLVWLRRNLIASGADKAVEVREVAVIPGTGTTSVTLHLNPGISMSSVLPTAGHAVHEAAAVGFDDLLRELRPDVVKVDVEGLDAALLSQSEELARADAPPLVVELNDGVEHAAAALGYRTINLTSLLELPDRSLQNASHDVLAYKPDRFDLDRFTGEYRRHLRRLRCLPSVRYVRR